MRKVLSGWLLVLAGTFLLSVALLLWFLIPGMVEKTPKNTDIVTYLYGNAQKLNPDNGKVQSVPVKIWNNNVVDPNRSTGDVVVFVERTCANINRNNPPRCLRKSDNRLISNEVDVFAVSRHTGLSVPNQSSYGTSAHSGLVNKFPFGTAKRTYPFWDNVLHKSFPAKFSGTADVNGLATYKFVMHVPKTRTDIVKGTKGTYQLDRTMWVEPVTGFIVNQTRHEIRLLPDGTTVINLHDHFASSTVATFVKDRKADVKRLNLYESVAPIVCCVLGVLLLVLGFFLTFRRRPERASVPEETKESVTIG